jgi:hypothetical protein
MFTDEEPRVQHRQRSFDDKETWVKNAPDPFPYRLPSAMAVLILCRPWWW